MKSYSFDEIKHLLTKDGESYQIDDHSVIFATSSGFSDKLVNHFIERNGYITFLSSEEYETYNVKDFQFILYKRFDI